MQENVVSESENKNPEEKDQMIEMVQSQIEAAESSATPKIVEVTGAEFDPEKAAFLYHFAASSYECVAPFLPFLYIRASCH